MQFPEANLLLAFVQDRLWNHASLQASLVATLLAAATRGNCDRTSPSSLAEKVRVLGLLVRSPPEGPAAVADDAAVVPQVFGARLGRLLADITYFQVNLAPGILNDRKESRSEPASRHFSPIATN